MTAVSTADGMKLLNRRAGKQPESAILAQVRDYLRARGWYVVRMQQGMGSHKGIADLYALRDGVSWWVEIKTPKGRQSEQQVGFAAAIGDHGGTYSVVRCLADAMILEEKHHVQG